MCPSLVAKAGWTLEQLRARARESLEQHGGIDAAVFEKLSALLTYIDGDYQDPRLPGAPPCSKDGIATDPLPGHSAQSIRNSG